MTTLTDFPDHTGADLSALLRPVRAGLGRIRARIVPRLRRAGRTLGRLRIVPVLLLAGATLLPAASAGARGGYAAQNGVALAGYDPVAYVAEGRAVAGSDTWSLRWRGVIWRFATPQNMQAFELDPSSYAPQFGGYCIESVIEGAPRPGDPKIFFLHEGRLYMGATMATKLRWAQDPDEMIERARASWRLIRQK